MNKKLALKKFNALNRTLLQFILCAFFIVLQHNKSIATIYSYSQDINKNLSAVEIGPAHSSENACKTNNSKWLSTKICNADNDFFIREKVKMLSERMNYRGEVSDRNISNYNLEITAQ